MGAGRQRAAGVEFHQSLLADSDPGFRAWGVRAAGNIGAVDAAVRDRVLSLAHDPAPEVRLQVAIAARKLDRSRRVGSVGRRAVDQRRR